jgi:hypothetical protein
LHLRALLLLLLVLAGHGAWAMGVRTSKRELARAADGAALLEVRELGPEGGGALSYCVEGKASADVVTFLVSSNFSPGGSSRPQRVSAAVCEQRIAALGAELSRRKITGVTLRPARCKTEGRDGLVVVKT